MMRFLTLLSTALLAASSVIAATGRPDLEVKASFSEKNPYNQVINGQTNKLNLLLVNHSPRELTVKSVSGAYREIGGREKYLRNTTAQRFSAVLPPSPNNSPVPLLYTFHSEFKPQELNLNVWVDYIDSDKKKYRELAYEGQVTILEQPGSWFDPALLFAYLILFSLLGLAGLVIYNTYFTGKNNKLNVYFKGTKKQQAANPAIAPTVSNPDGKKYSDEWIPDHHKKSTSSKASQTVVGATSDSEGGNTSAGARKRAAAAGKGKAKRQ